MPDDPTFEQRLRRVEDLLEIQQLCNDYGHHLDNGDVEAYAALFADDGELLLGPVARARGRDEIRDAMTSVLGAPRGSSIHIIGAPTVELAGDTATSEVMWTVVSRDDAGNALLSMTGRHRDDLVREHGSWRIKRRRGFVDIPSAFPSRDER